MARGATTTTTTTPPNHGGRFTAGRHAVTLTWTTSPVPAHRSSSWRSAARPHTGKPPEPDFETAEELLRNASTSLS